MPVLISLAPLVIGFCVDLILGDPHSIPHPVVLIGKLISGFEKLFRRLFPRTPRGEKLAGLALGLCVAALSWLVPAALLWLCRQIAPWLALALESAMCWQILATKSLRDESMKVFRALESVDLTASRRAVSMIVGRDTQRLDEAGWPGPPWRRWRKTPPTAWWPPWCSWPSAARPWGSSTRR